MTPADQDDPIFRMLARLPRPEPSAARSERVLERCHNALRRRVQWQRHRRGFARRIVEPAVVGGFALVYVVAMVFDLWRWHSGLR